MLATQQVASTRRDDVQAITRVVQHLAEPDVLTVVRKARLQEKHKGGLLYTWDVLEDLFPAGLVAGMFAAYGRLLGELASGSGLSPVTV